MENQNDTQDVQPEQYEQESGDEQVTQEPQDDSSDVNERLEKLENQLKEKDDQIAQLSRTKRELKKKTKKDSSSNTDTQEGLDYGQKAYLRTEGIEATEFDFVQEQMQESGLPVEQLLANGYFQAQLKDRREQKSVEDATPSSTRTAGGESPKSTPEYWVQRGERPENTPENRKLRQAIVNKKMEVEYEKSKFSDQGIVEGV